MAFMSLDLKELCPADNHRNQEKGMFSTLEWSSLDYRLAYISAKACAGLVSDSCTVKLWNPSVKAPKNIINASNIPAGWYIPFKNSLKWNGAGMRLFFGLRPLSDTSVKDEKITFSDSNYYHTGTIVKKAQLEVWHWNDPRIKPNQIIWNKENKNKVYYSVYNFISNQIVQLADSNLPDVEPNDAKDYAIGFNDKPYLKEMTWDGFFSDLYILNLNTGTRKLVARRLAEGAHLSPQGKFVCYFADKCWMLYDCEKDSTINLTSRIEAKFEDEDWDNPGPAASYGFAGWVENDEAALIYDKYDIWQFFTGQGYGYLNQTALDGRMAKVTFRILNIEPDKSITAEMIKFTFQAFSTATSRLEYSE